MRSSGNQTANGRLEGLGVRGVLRCGLAASLLGLRAAPSGPPGDGRAAAPLGGRRRAPRAGGPGQGGPQADRRRPAGAQLPDAAHRPGDADGESRSRTRCSGPPLPNDVSGVGLDIVEQTAERRRQRRASTRTSAGVNVVARADDCRSAPRPHRSARTRRNPGSCAQHSRVRSRPALPCDRDARPRPRRTARQHRSTSAPD